MKEIEYKIVIMLLILVLALSSFMTFSYQKKFKMAINIGAENTINALKLVVACQAITNVTSDEIFEKTVEMFILNKTGDPKK